MGEKEKFGIAINLSQCNGVARSDLPGNNWICAFDENPDVLSVYQQIKQSFESVDRDANQKITLSSAKVHFSKEVQGTVSLCSSAKFRVTQWRFYADKAMFEEVKSWFKEA